ncbi:MAG TPA: hypothetical protein VK009_18100 [Chloroflexota bacterium]|nr:hypothetical protein [Chloroflexota bacterium]
MEASGAAGPDVAHEVSGAFDQLRNELEAASPDWLLLLSNDHLKNRFFPYCPPFVLGVAGSFFAPPEPAAGLNEMTVPSDEGIGRSLLESAWELGADFAYSDDMILDHGSTVPLHFLTPKLDLPVIHLNQLTARPPYAPLKRSYAVGGILRRCIESRPASERVAVVGTGGLSHWVGNPKMGRVNVDWDSRMLDLFLNRRHDKLLAMTDADVEQGGNGAHEIRNWVTLAGLVPEARGELVSRVERIAAWFQSSAHVRFALN